MYNFPPSSLYQMICTPEALRKVPGSPSWRYDGQFIWLPKQQSVKTLVSVSNFPPYKQIYQGDFSGGIL